MTRFVNLINGQVRIKVSNFTKACTFLGINMIPADPNVPALDPYFSGCIYIKLILIDLLFLMPKLLGKQDCMSFRIKI